MTYFHYIHSNKNDSLASAIATYHSEEDISKYVIELSHGAQYKKIKFKNSKLM